MCFHLRIVLRPNLFLLGSFVETREEEIIMPAVEGERSGMKMEKIAKKIDESPRKSPSVSGQARLGRK